MKKIFALLIVCAILASAMTACVGHSHTESADWAADASRHWKLCSGCEEKLQFVEHTLDEDGHCGVCNSDITVFEDSVRVITCDAEGNVIAVERYDNDGNPLSKNWEERLYDENDCLIEEQYYVNGMLNNEVKYTVVDGESIPVKYTECSEDGTMLVREFDVYGNELSAVSYDAEGNVSWQTSSQYAHTINGDWYLLSYTQVEADGTKNVVIYTEYGDTASDITLDAEGNIVTDYAWEYTYVNGIMTSEKSYENGVIYSEINYKVLNGEDGPYSYVETEISYNDDGSRCACVYSESGELIGMTSYDADGNVIE